LIKELREAITQENDERITALTSDLQQALYSVSANLYQQAGGDAGASSPDGSAPSDGDAPTGGSSGSDDVIDAEFSETK
jgi:hypothetical protein